MSAPADRDARADIVDALDVNLFVEAGAGTGKTHELVRRVVNLVAHGVDPRRMAVITFTEAAAAELRERVREQLTVAARSSEDEDARASCTAALSVLDDAAIGTLHSFAQRILTEFPVDAGLPPGFEVLDEIEAGVAFAERWARWSDRVYDDERLADAITAAAVLGITTKRLERVARELSASWDRARGWLPAAEPVPIFDPSPVLTAIDAATALAPQCRFEDDRLLEHLENVGALGDEVRAALDPLEALELLAAQALGGGQKGRAQNWTGGGKAEVLDRLAEAEAARVAAVQAVREPAMRTLVAEVAKFVHESVEQRRREGRVEFHDLLVFAVDLVRGHPHVRARLHERYERLLLDEFQDTDPIQIELAVLIASGDADAGSRPWWECRVEPGRMFVVGDPKQSIYRFRRADIELYRHVREVLGERDGGLRTLVTSFRCRPAILDFVNEVFTPLMSGDSSLQAQYHSLTADRPPCEVTPDPVRTFGARAPKDTNLHRLRQLEARELAAIVRRVRDEGWPVRDRATQEGTRKARYEDIAILLPTRTTLPYLEEALDEADVPTRIESQSLVFATTEVQELLQVLQAIDDPVDDVAVVAALRSPGFGCSDNDLVEFARADGRWDYRVDPPAELDADHPVVAGLRALRSLHERRWWDGVSDLVERVIRERRLLELAVERRRPRDTWRRLRFVADAARAYTDRGGTSVRGFVGWAFEQADEDARVVEVIVPEPDDDAVRVLTAHGAKGLEFPIVLLTGLGLREQPRTGSVLFGPDGPELRIGPDGSVLLTPGFEDLKKHEHDAWRAEQLRLLYVALTRAEDHLLVSMHRKEGDTCLANCLADAAAGRPEITGSAASAPPRPPALADTPRARPDRAQWIAARAARIESTRRAPSVAATALAKAVAGTDDPGLDKAETDASDAPPWRRGRAGTAVGRAVHAVLQTVDLDTGDGLAATARAQALAEDIPLRESEIRALVESVLASPTVRRASNDDCRYWREVPVAIDVNGVLIEGFIDLLIETPGGFVVVDYKTDPAPSAEELDAALARYTPQGATYALALETSLGKPVSRCVFVFARRGEAVEREIADLSRAVDSVRREVSALAPT